MDHVRSDLTVVGGGIAGTCAAIAAARLGLTVALVNDRPVLGGNASSEVRVWVNGATGGNHNKYAREGGIMEELLLRNKAENHDGGADRWDAVLIDAVRDTDGCTAYLNTRVDAVATTGDRIDHVAGTQSTTERRLQFESPYYVDATGDGLLAARAGVPYASGREGTDAYGESAAPAESDDRTLGSSIMFYTVDAGEPVEYTAPAFARDFRDDPPAILAQRADPTQRRCCFWWIEYGGDEDLDPIADAEAIRDELWAIVYGVWDFMKHDPDLAAETETLRLEWVGKIPGTRESRRCQGAYVLREADLVEQRQFGDTVAHGGWPIDLHPPAGFYDDQGAGADQWHLPGPYRIPLRSLYAPDAPNLLFAGRHLSASHVAFGSARVQMTLATVGQAAGTAAAIGIHEEASPATVHDEHLEAVQQTLLREDQWVIGEQLEHPDDLAPAATVTASSVQPSANRDANEPHPLTADLALRFPIDDPAATVRLRAVAAEPSVLDVECWTEDRPENYVPHERQWRRRVEVPTEPTWIELPVECDPGDAGGLSFVLRRDPSVSLLGRAGVTTGIMALPRDQDAGDPDAEISRADTFWGQSAHHGRPPLDWTPAFSVTPAPTWYPPEAAADGFARPYGGPHCWRSDPDDAGPDWIELCWPEPQSIATVDLVCNTRLTKWYNIFGRESLAVPTAICDYRIEADGDPVHVETDNVQRFRRHAFDPVEAERLRIVVEETHGARATELFAVRAYGPEPQTPLVPR